MKISFFEEFPSKKTMGKLKYVTWPTTVYVAAKNVEEISVWKRKGVKIAWWPVLAKEEGYWFSPFSSARAVERVLSQVRSVKNKHKIMWDAELPFRHPWLFLRLDNYIRNRRIIRNFFREHGERILTSEYPVKNTFFEKLFRTLGVSFSPKKYGNKKIIMYYTSMHPHVRKLFLTNLEQLYKKYGKNLQVGLGTIAPGILGNEPILSPQDLERDLNDMRKIGVKEVVIFRLGGVNHKYAKVLQKFL